MSGFETVAGIAGLASTGLGIAGGEVDHAAQSGMRSFSQAGARLNARQVGNQAAAREWQVRRQASQLLGAQAAAVAESGTGAGGSNRLIMEQDATLAELDALGVRYEGRLKIQEYDAEALALKPQPSAMQKLLGKRGLGQLNYHYLLEPQNREFYEKFTW